MSDEASTVLNKTLYLRLKQVFGQVVVRSAGEQQTTKSAIDLKTGSRVNRIVHPGEYYAVCCPLCNDTRFRCNINYEYGRRTEFGYPKTYLAYCFNFGCPLCSKERSAYQKLEEIVLGDNPDPLKNSKVKKGKVVDVDAIRMSWPGSVTRVDRLPPTHEASQYLVSRGFDPEVIGGFYNVHWCSESERRLAHQRLIIPIYMNKKMVGWQARPAFDVDDWKQMSFPKYYTVPGTPRGHLLYNYGNASKFHTGVLVEGPTDVWRVGPCAMATLGAGITAGQESLISSGFKDGSCFLLFDADVWEISAKLDLKQQEQKRKAIRKLQETVKRLNDSLKSGFCKGDLPSGVDPGSMSRDSLVKFVRGSALQQGVKISFKREK